MGSSGVVGSIRGFEKTIMGWLGFDPATTQWATDPNPTMSTTFGFLTAGLVGRSVAVIVGVSFIIIAVIAVTLTSDAGKTVIKEVIP